MIMYSVTYDTITSPQAEGGRGPAEEGGGEDAAGADQAGVPATQAAGAPRGAGPGPAQAPQTPQDPQAQAEGPAQVHLQGGVGQRQVLFLHA